MLTRTQQDKQMLTCNFDYMKEYPRQAQGVGGS
jgi:hypothetical protein